MWSGLCAGGSLCQRCCRRPEFLPCEPHTLLCGSWPLEGDQCLYYCARKGSCWGRGADSRTDHYIQTHPTTPPPHPTTPPPHASTPPPHTTTPPPHTTTP